MFKLIKSFIELIKRCREYDHQLVCISAFTKEIAMKERIIAAICMHYPFSTYCGLMTYERLKSYDKMIKCFEISMAKGCSPMDVVL